jgi:hypothetical protein
MQKALGDVFPARLMISTRGLKSEFLSPVDNKFNNRHARSLHRKRGSIVSVWINASSRFTPVPQQKTLCFPVPRSRAPSLNATSVTASVRLDHTAKTEVGPKGVVTISPSRSVSIARGP